MKIVFQCFLLVAGVGLLPFPTHHTSQLAAEEPPGDTAYPNHAQVLEVEVINDALPVFDPDAPVSSMFRFPAEDEVFPPMRVLLSRERYWQEDRHMDVVVRLEPSKLAELADSRLEVVLRDDGDTEISRFEIDPVPGPQFIFYPALPTDFTGGGHIELVWSDEDGRELARDRQIFRVETFQESAPRTGQVALRVLNEPGAAVENFPVTMGVPFPRGTLTDTAHLRLVDGEGREIPLQAEATARWSKFGPVKWVRCDFTIDLDGEPREVYLQYGPEVSRTEGEPIQVEADGDAIVLEAGRLRIDGAGMWVHPPGAVEAVKVLAGDAMNGAFVEHEDSRIYRTLGGEEGWEVEEIGPEKVVLRRAGWYREPENGGEFCQHISRWILYRDAPVARLFHTWIFTGDGNSDRIRNMGWGFELGEGMAPVGFLTGFGGEGEWEAGEFLLQWDYDHFDIYGEAGLEEYVGGRAPGVALAEGEGVRLYFGAKDFWRNYPSELEFGRGTLWFHNWPRHNRPAGYRFDGELVTESGEPALPSAARHAQYEAGRLTNSEWRLNAVQHRYAHEGEVLDFRLPEEFGEDPIQQDAGRGRPTSLPWIADNIETVNAQGVSRTEEVWLYFASDETDDLNNRKVLEGLNDETLRGVVDPVWVAASGAFYEMHHQDWENFPEEERIYELVNLSVGQVMERLGVYGMWIYGDLPAWEPRLSKREPALYRAYRKRHHGWPYSWKAYARSGDPRWLKFAEASTRQMVDANYCHYADENVRQKVGGNKGRRIGRWQRGILPWGGRREPTIRGYESGTDFLWYAYYLTNYHRAKENALDWGRQTKQEDPSPYQGSLRAIGDRPTITTLKSYVEMYEATFDPWFLVAAHALADANYHTRFRVGAGRTWDTAEREFLRFTGAGDFEDYYLQFVTDLSRHDHHSTWSRHSPQFGDLVYAWKISGDDHYLRRAARGVEYGTSIVKDGGEPDYFIGYPIVRGEATAYTLFTSYYLRWFPAGLWALANAEETPEPIANTVSLGKWSVAGVEKPGTIVTLRKPPDAELVLTLRGVRGVRDTDLAEYEVVGPDGGRLLSDSWVMNRPHSVTIPAPAPAGDYELRVFYRETRHSGMEHIEAPVSGVDHPEVFVLSGDQGFPSIGFDSPVWFMVPEGVESFELVFIRPYGTSVWTPDGRRVFSLYQDEPSDFPARVEIDVPPGQAGKLWRLSLPGEGMRLDPRIPPVFAFDRTRWFMPDKLSPEREE